MHELEISRGLLEAVRRRAQGRPVVRMRARVGARHGVAQAAFQRVFSTAATGTVLEDAFDRPGWVHVPGLRG